MTVHSVRYVKCDGLGCNAQMTIPRDESEEWIPQWWIRTVAPSLEFLWQTTTYHFCSTGCYSSVEDEVTDLMRSYYEHEANYG
jgi:hypothetical protein